MQASRRLKRKARLRKESGLCLYAEVLLPTLKGIDTAMSNQEQTLTNSPHLPFHAYANIGDEDNLVSVKRFATKKDAEAWIEQLAIERPGYYMVIHESGFGTPP